MRIRRAGTAVAALLLGVSGCSGGETTPDATPVGFFGPGATGGSGDTGRLRALPIGTGWGPTEAEIDRARRLVGRLTLRERAGQVIVASYDGTSAPTKLVRDLHLGGVVVFSDNYSSTGQIRASNRALQDADDRRWPVLVSVDQEGGLVERVTGGTRFPAFMTTGAADRSALTRDAAAGSGRELAGLGFNVDFAPVADVTAGDADPVIGSRSAGSSPDLVSRQVAAAASGFRSAGVLPVLKHVPGHGGLTTDSHVGLPVQDATVEEMEAHDLVPFRDGIDAGLPAVMVGHIDVREVDPGTPATLSRKVVTGLLRERLGFDGLAVTDSLQMQPIRAEHSSGEAAVRALRAGQDVLLMPMDPRAARDGIVRAVRDGRLSQARLDQAAIRLVAMLLHQKAQGSSPAPPGSATGVSRRLSAAGLTVVAGACEGRLVGRRIRLVGSSTAHAAFRAAATRAGLRFAPKGARVALAGVADPVPRGIDVLVATDRPYLLGTRRAPVKIATYGETPGAMAALVDVLLGRAAAPGQLPVEVSGVARAGC